METDELLAREARLRPRAAAAAAAGGILTLLGGIYNAVTFSDVPRAGLAQALERAAEPGPVGSAPSSRIPLYEFYSDHATQLLLGSAIGALGALGAAAALTFLAYATAGRRTFPRAGLYVSAIGGGLLAAALVIVAIGTDATVNEVLDGPRTVDAVADVQGSSVLVAGQLIEVAGRFTLGAAFILVCLNAMRAGLLTRFMGVLGIIAGVLLALPIFGGPLPVVQVFWLVALGVLLGGLWPGGMPRAWTTGEAVPWPSAAEVREHRRAQAEAVRDREPAGGGDGEPGAERSGEAHPASKKKRKRRR